MSGNQGESAGRGGSRAYNFRGPGDVPLRCCRAMLSAQAPAEPQPLPGPQFPHLLNGRICPGLPGRSKDYSYSKGRCLAPSSAQSTPTSSLPPCPDNSKSSKAMSCQARDWPLPGERHRDLEGRLEVGSDPLSLAGMPWTLERTPSPLGDRWAGCLSLCVGSREFA